MAKVSKRYKALSALVQPGKIAQVTHDLLDPLKALTRSGSQVIEI